MAFPRPLNEDDSFLRAVNPYVHLKPDGTLSSAAFYNSSNTNSMSVDWAGRSTPADTVSRFPDWPETKFVASVTAGTYWDLKQTIEFSPTTHNPAHTDIIGDKTASVRKKLARTARILWP